MNTTEQKSIFRPATSRNVSMSEIARQLGCSVTTVSRVLSNPQLVADETRQKVLEAVGRKNMISRRARNKYITLGVSVYFVKGIVLDPYISHVLAGIQEAGYEFEFRIQMVDLLSQRRIGETPLQLLNRLELDGMIYIAPSDNIVDMAKELASAGVSQFFVGSRCDDKRIGWVDAENFESSKNAVKYLLSLGHKNVAIMAAWQETLDQQIRLDGYRAALREAGIECCPDWEICRRNVEPVISASYTMELLTMHPQITAIYYTNSSMAYGGIKACQKMGLRIPEDISIVAFTDSNSSDFSSPEMTCIYQPAFEMSKIAAREIMLHIKHPERNMKQEVISPDFHIRGTTGPVPDSSRKTVGNSAE